MHNKLIIYFEKNKSIMLKANNWVLVLMKYPAEV